jgi:signal transduction histidine kinase
VHELEELLLRRTRGAEPAQIVSADIVRAQEEERRRIACDIHDDSVQAMAAVLLRIGILGARLDDPEEKRLVTDIETSVRDSITRLRRVIVGLALPELDCESIVLGVRTLLEGIKADSGVDFRLESRLSTEPSAEGQTIAYRIVQEAVTNARKHAEASHLHVTLESDEAGVLGMVRDDGVGFDVAAMLADPRPGHLGLRAMRERAELLGGRLDISSRPGETTVRFWLPERRLSEVRD